MATKKPQEKPLSKKEILEGFIREGDKIFGKPKRSNREGYGIKYGSKDLLAYAKYIDPEFESPRHIRLIAEYLVKVEKGEIERLIINMPPRHGKSQFASKIFPTWFLGRNPKRKIIVTSYNASLAEEFTRWQRNTCESDYFREVFPECQVTQDSRAKDEWDTSLGGKVIGAGVGGGITGKGANLIIIDDPYKNFEEARSEAVQRMIWEWYRSTLYTRRHPGCGVIVIHTRWITNDLTDKLIEQDGLVTDGGAWNILKLPAIDEFGVPLWPERYNLDELLSIRRAIGENFFQGGYQQQPNGNVERLFRDPIITEPPADMRLKILAYLDPAFGGGDYSALTVGASRSEPRNGKDEDIIYILYGHIWQGQIDETYRRMERYYKDYNIGTLWVESNQAQTAVASEMRRRGMYVREIKSINNKHLRIVNAVKVNWDNIRFSRRVDQDYLAQVLNYSELAKHDDAPDSLAGLIGQLGVASVSLVKRYSIFGKRSWW